MPLPLEQFRESLTRRTDGDRQFVGVLSAIATYGLDAVASACAAALREGAPSRDVVLNILSRAHDDPDLPNLTTSHLPPIVCEPLADCCRYDTLLCGGKVNA